MSGSNTVHIVHCIDTEGPLTETVEAELAKTVLKAI